MAATQELLYGPAGQAVTITLNSLTSSAAAGRASTAVDNSTPLAIDALVTVKVKMPSTGTPANDKGVYVFAYGTSDGGTNYTDGVTGTDAAFTRTDPPNLKLIGFINCPVNTNSFNSGPMSVANAFGGVLPQKWGIFVQNYTGLTLDTTGNSAFYQLVYGQSV